MEATMGSSNTGDDLVAGHHNLATDTTLIVAVKRREGEDWDPNCKSILVVTPSAVMGDRPPQRVDGIVGFAHRGGAGVRGLGNQPEGARGPRSGSGNGGDGVVGHGGTGDLEKGVGIHSHPGIGVLGIGGIWTGPASLKGGSRDSRGGAGVIGVGGGDRPAPWVPSFDDTKGVGVYGISGVGEGIVALGNTAGLRANGKWGVDATGSDGGIKAEGDVGVQATGRNGPAGVFMRYSQPPPGKTLADTHVTYELGALSQIFISPQPMAVPDPEDMEEAVKVLPADGVDQLPVAALAGELLLTLQPSKNPSVPGFEPEAEAILWLCVKSAVVKIVNSEIEKVPAVWKQVLLGPPINGTRDNPPWYVGNKG
jgi:hypothetical protein